MSPAVREGEHIAPPRQADESQEGYAFGDSVRKFRLLAGFTQEGAARRLQERLNEAGEQGARTGQSWANWERHRSKPHPNVLRYLADSLVEDLSDDATRRERVARRRQVRELLDELRHAWMLDAEVPEHHNGDGRKR